MVGEWAMGAGGVGGCGGEGQDVVCCQEMSRQICALCSLAANAAPPGPALRHARNPCKMLEAPACNLLTQPPLRLPLPFPLPLPQNATTPPPHYHTPHPTPPRRRVAQNCGELGEDDIKMVLSADGTPLGEAFVHFKGPDAKVRMALAKDHSVLPVSGAAWPAGGRGL